MISCGYPGGAKNLFSRLSGCWWVTHPILNVPKLPNFAFANKSKKIANKYSSGTP
jgi:hypothetical protein